MRREHVSQLLQYKHHESPRLLTLLADTEDALGPDTEDRVAFSLAVAKYSIA